MVGKKLVEPKRSGRYPRCIEQGIEVDGDPGFPWQRDKEGDKGLKGVFGHYGLQYGRWDILVVMKLKSPAGYRKEFLFQYDRWDFLVVKENL